MGETIGERPTVSDMFEQMKSALEEAGYNQYPRKVTVNIDVFGRDSAVPGHGDDTVRLFCFSGDEYPTFTANISGGPDLLKALLAAQSSKPRFTLEEADDLSLHMRRLSARILEVGHGVGGEASETLGRIAIDVADAARRLQGFRR